MVIILLIYSLLQGFKSTYWLRATRRTEHELHVFLGVSTIFVDSQPATKSVFNSFFDFLVEMNFQKWFSICRIFDARIHNIFLPDHVKEQLFILKRASLLSYMRR